MEDIDQQPLEEGDIDQQLFEEGDIDQQPFEEGDIDQQPLEEGDIDITVSPPSSAELIRAKSFLMTNSSATNFNLYDHLAALLTKILRERITDAVDCLEEISMKVKDDKYESEKALIERPASDNEVLLFVQRIQNLIQVAVGEKTEPDSGEPKNEEELELIEEPPLPENIDNQMDAEQIDSIKETIDDIEDIPNLCNDMLYFNQTGFGFGKEETFKLTLALKMLVKTYNLKHVYFWGKVLGIKCNYYIAEAHYREGLEDDENAWIDKEEIQPDSDIEKIQQESEEGAEILKDESEQPEDITENKAEDLQETGETEIKPDNNIETEETGLEESHQEEQEGNVADIPISEEQTAETGKEEEHIQEEIPLEEEMEEIVMPIPHYEPPHPIPTEDNGMGINKYVYFVCSEFGMPWKRLPNVTPAQIVAARMMKKFFTGDLMTQVSTYPPFPGKEAHYLRAQIARISSSTHISPVGYYYFESPVQPVQEGELEENMENIDVPIEVKQGGEGEEGAEGEITISPKVSELKINYVKDPNYIPSPVSKMLNDGLEAWVHHKQFILNQGRCSWYEHIEQPPEVVLEEGQVEGEIIEEEPKPVEEIVPEAQEEEGMKDEEQPENIELQEEIKPEKEDPLPLLKPISLDKGIGNLPAWTIHNPSYILPQFGVAGVRSVNWPGAYAFSNGKIFSNIYIGFGQKYSMYHFSPPLPSDVQQEYLFGPEIIEHESEIPAPVIIEEKKEEEELIEFPISMDVPSETGEQWARGTQTDLDASDEMPPSTETLASDEIPQLAETETSDEIIEEILPEDS